VPHRLGRTQRIRLSPAQFLAVSFAGFIAAGAFLLYLPASSETGQRLAFIDAFFTSTSAVCVTGLIVVDTPNAFSTFGEAVVLALIQAGGLGYMTLSTLIAVAVGKRLSLAERSVLQESLNVDSREGLVRFALSVLAMTALFELTGTVILTLHWWGEMGLGHAAYFGLFHAVSAFNNAGFALLSDNLVRYRGDVIVNLVITGLVIAGGMGFFVLREMWHKRSFRALGLHTKLAVSLTAFLLALGTVLLWALELHNQKTLGSLGWGESLLAAWFASVTPRTAGFNTIDVGGMTQAGLFVTMVLMFIGASPGGTGGGVKTTTFGVTVFALLATVRGQAEPVVFGRRIVTDVVARAFFISLTAFLAMNAIAASLLIVEGRDLLRTLFEATSAFGTVGLSMGLPGTPLSLAAGFGTGGKLLLVLMMFLGRVGPLTVAVALAGRTRVQRVTYPEGRVLIG
jgi:trk system potassium uptake protein TrkH